MSDDLTRRAEQLANFLCWRAPSYVETLADLLAAVDALTEQRDGWANSCSRLTLALHAAAQARAAAEQERDRAIGELDACEQHVKIKEEAIQQLGARVADLECIVRDRAIIVRNILEGER